MLNHGLFLWQQIQNQGEALSVTLFGGAWDRGPRAGPPIGPLKRFTPKPILSCVEYLKLGHVCYRALHPVCSLQPTAIETRKSLQKILDPALSCFRLCSCRCSLQERLRARR